MFDLIINKAENTIEQHRMLDNCNTVIVGVSGGADSVCLFFVLKEICSKRNIKLVVAHVNHMLRGTAAYDDELFVSQLCQVHGVPFKVLNFDVGKYAKENGLGVEESGRIIRYKFFNQLCEEHEKAKIAVAHNRNDRGETIFLNILRGSGLNGLNGIPYVRDNIIRPLLDVNREDIELCLKELGITPRIDESNEELIYRRNVIRNEVFPYLNERFNMNIAESLIRLSENVSLDDEFLKELSLDTFNKLVTIRSKQIIFDVNKLLLLNKAILSRVIILSAKKLYQINGTDELKKPHLETKHVRMVQDLINNKSNIPYICLVGGIRVRKEYDKLIFFAKEDNNYLVDTYEYTISLNELMENKEMTLRLDEIKCNINFGVMDKCIEKYSQKDFKQCFDYGIISKVSTKENLPLVIRNRREGDFIKPAYGKGSRKLKKFFIDNKIPREVRNSMPLLALGCEIIWVPGYRSSDNFKVTKESKDILIVSIECENNNFGGFVND